MLKGNQKKLDLNKNKKIDKGDFKLLGNAEKKSQLSWLSKTLPHLKVEFYKNLVQI